MRLRQGNLLIQKRMNSEKSKPDNLSPKQIAFCHEYLLDFNGAAAAVRAGYSKKTARTIASNQLTKVNIRNYLKTLQAQLALKHEVSKDLVVTELKHIGISDVRKLFDSSGCLKDIHSIDDATASAISSIEIEELIVGGKPIGKTKKLKFWPKTNALESLANILGYKAPAKVEVDYNSMTESQLNHIVDNLIKSASHDKRTED